jgi:hypothetical protein
MYTLTTLWVESHGMKENFIAYIMTSVKAKQDWVPFGYLLRERKVFKDLDYSRIEFKIPYLTDATGYYHAQEYQFNDQSL